MNLSMNDSASRTGIFLMAHGAPESTDDIPEYLKKIRGGKESSPCLLYTSDAADDLL